MGLQGFLSSPLPLIGRKILDTRSRDLRLIIRSYVSAYLLDPLLAPVHAILNTFIGLVVFVLITTIGISYSGALYVVTLMLVISFNPIIAILHTSQSTRLPPTTIHKRATM